MDSLLRLKELIQTKGITGKELAEALEVSSNTITNFIQGNRFPRPEMLKSLAEALDVDIKELFHSTKEANKTNRLFVEHEGKYYPVGTIDRALFDGVSTFEPVTLEPMDELKLSKDQPIHKQGRYLSQYIDSGFEAYWDNFHLKADIAKSTADKKKAFKLWSTLKEEGINLELDRIKSLKGRYYNIIGYMQLL